MALAIWVPVPFQGYEWCEIGFRDLSFSSDTHGIAVGTCMSVYRSIDGGLTWARDTTTGDLGVVNAVHLGEGLGVAVGQNALFQPTALLTRDEGASFDWSIFYLTDPTGTWNEGALSDVRALSPDVAVAVAAVWNGEGAIARTTNSGTDWSTVAWLPNALLALDFDGAHGVAVGAGGSAYTTDDGGLTWTPRTSGAVVTLRDVAIAGNAAVAVGDTGAAIVSADGGATWLPGVTGSVADLDALAVAPDGTLLATGAAGAVLHSTDGGLSWSPEVALTSSDLRAVAFRPDGAAFAMGTDTILQRVETALA